MGVTGTGGRAVPNGRRDTHRPSCWSVKSGLNEFTVSECDEHYFEGLGAPLHVDHQDSNNNGTIVYHFFLFTVCSNTHPIL